MKSIVLSLILGVGVAHCVCAQSHSASTTAISNASQKGVLEAEGRFSSALRERNTVIVASLLADYYADSQEGSEHAIPKVSVLARLKLGTLPTYEIVKDLRVSSNAEMITVEGTGKARGVKLAGGPEEDKWLYIRRLWTKKDGKYILVAQIRREVSDESIGAKK